MEANPEIASLAARHNLFFYASLVLPIVSSIFAFLVWKSAKDLRGAESRASQLIIAQVQLEAARAVENTENLKQQNVKLEIELERERQERLKLARRVGERTIYPEEKDLIVSRLKAYPNQKVAVNILASNDPEVISFADQIMNALRDAGWTVTLASKTYLISPSPPFYGVSCRVSKQRSPSVRDFLSVFDELGIDPKVQELEAVDIANDYLIVDIGLKRPYVR